MRNPLPRTELAFPVSLLVKGEPRPAGMVPAPDRFNRVAYGGYVANLAGCIECHTPMVKGKPDTSRLLAGGETFQFGPGLIAASANLTPDPATGIGAWSERRFLDTFYRYRQYIAREPTKVGLERFTIMPRLGFARMEEEDLTAVYFYLKTVQPESNRVVTQPLLAVR